MNTALRIADVAAQPADAIDPLTGLRVALFTGNYNYVKEGANQALNKLVAHLERRLAAQVRVYSPVTDTPAFEPEGTLVPVPSVALPGRSEFRLALGLPRVSRDDIRRFSPQVVHVATPDILGHRAQRFARELGVPIVASLHTRFETYCAYYGLGIVRPMIERILAGFYGGSDMVLVPTPGMVEEMAPALGRDRLRVWGRGVDTALFDPARRRTAWRIAQSIGEHEIAVLFFGRIVLEKGIDTYAQTVRILRAQGLPVRPLVVGQGPACERMRTLLPDAVFTGHLAGADLAAAVASADLFINPSLTETFGNVTLEAMASGLAVIAADVPSSANLIEHGVNGMVAPSDPAAFAALAADLLRDPACRAALGEAARRAALDWSWDRILDDVIEDYRIVLARHATAGGRA
ncbi:MAG TPA: glycosyltransferase family 1 protein [Novosphingobium sp.]|nr:glycosyltransferase family 1 protein [Novosphingobium sp.]